MYVGVLDRERVCVHGCRERPRKRLVIIIGARTVESGDEGHTYHSQISLVLFTNINSPPATVLIPHRYLVPYLS